MKLYEVTMNSAIVVYRDLGRILIQLERIISVVGFALIRTFKKAEMLVYSENNESELILVVEDNNS